MRSIFILSSALILFSSSQASADVFSVDDKIMPELSVEDTNMVMMSPSLITNARICKALRDELRTLRYWYDVHCDERPYGEGCQSYEDDINRVIAQMQDYCNYPRRTVVPSSN